MPNNASRLLIYLINIGDFIPFLRPLAIFTLSISKIGSKTHWPVHHYALRKPLKTFSICVPTNVNNIDALFINWILLQPSALNSNHTLTTHMVISRDESVSFSYLHCLLAATSSSLLHLRLSFKLHADRAVVSPNQFSAFPSLQLKLQSLSIHIDDFFCDR